MSHDTPTQNIVDSQPITNMPTMSKLHRWMALVVLLFAQFVLAIDMTVLNVALPSMTAELRPTSDQQLWIIDVYSLVLAGLLVSASSLSDRIGRKKMLLGGALLFCIGSALILWAYTPEIVIAIRALLGIGAAMIMPTTISMIRNIFTEARERAFALAAWSVLGGLGMALGPIIGGFLLEHLSWHAAFLVNIPLMAAVLVVGFFILPEITVIGNGPWDVPAALISLIGMASLMWGIKHLAAKMTVTDLAGSIAIVLGLICIVVFVVRSLRRTTPLIDMTLFRDRSFTGGIIVALGSMFSMAALLFLLAQWLQLVDGCTPLESGIKLLPLAIASLITGAAAPVLAMKFPAHKVLIIGLAVGAFAMLMLLPFINDLTYAPVAVSSALVGAGTGVLAIGSAAIMNSTPPTKASSAAAIEEIAYDLGNVLGVALMGSVASVVYRLGLDPNTLAEAGLDQANIDAAMQSFSSAVAIAQQTGTEILIAQGTASFNESIVVTAAIGGAVMLAVTALAYRLIPKDLDITEAEH
ncbi:MAG: MFS transporter [Eggerthellaceae bacterium]